MSSPWSSGADSSSIWNSNSPNLNLLRRYSLRSSNAAGTAASLGHTPPASASSKSSCSWEQSSDAKYLVGYMVISRQDLELYHATLGFQLCGGRQTLDGQYGAIVEHVTPGGLMNIICKLKVGDEIVEWNGFNLRNKRNDEVCAIIEAVKHNSSLRLVAVRLLNPSGANTSAGQSSGGKSGANNSVTSPTSANNN